MTHRTAASIITGTLLAIVLTGCTSHPDSTAATATPVPSIQDSNGISPCFEPPPEAIQTAQRYIRDTPQNFGGQKAPGPWQGYGESATEGMILATRLPDGQLAVFYLTGGPVYDIVEINNAFRGYGPAASCL
jgi:hypothetical protein